MINAARNKYTRMHNKYDCNCKKEIIEIPAIPIYMSQGYVSNVLLFQDMLNNVLIENNL